jgi:hypothetical protein
MRLSALAIVVLLAITGAGGVVDGAHWWADDCDTEGPAGSSWQDATPLQPPVSCEGLLHSQFQTVDYYKVACWPGETLAATVTSDYYAVNVRLQLPVNVPGYHLDWQYTGDEGRAHVETTCTVPGEYRIQLLYGGMNSEWYDVPYHLEVPEPGVKLTSAL